MALHHSESGPLQRLIDESRAKGQLHEMVLDDDDRGPRCLCGHYKVEHGEAGRCMGAYATLMADADDFESVEVHCPCDRFYKVGPTWHEVRT